MPEPLECEPNDHGDRINSHDDSTVIYIGLGSNIDNPASQLDAAINTLSTLLNSELIATSAYFSSSPVGPQDQPDFINAVVKMKSALSPTQLLTHLQTIERQQGRIKKRHWGERSIDLDILLYGNLELDSKELSIPHKELANRDFVLRPLLDLTPSLALPDGTPLSLLLDRCPDNHLKRISKPI